MALGCERAGENCDTSAAASVQITFVDADGAGIEGADVTWWQDGGDAQPCDEMGGGEYVCGWEVGGELTIAVEAEGFAPYEGVIEVPEGECHVQTQIVEHVLEAT